jgi:hypothetical protein
LENLNRKSQKYASDRDCTLLEQRDKAKAERDETALAIAAH